MKGKKKKKKSTIVRIRRPWSSLAFKLSIAKSGKSLNIPQIFIDNLLGPVPIAGVIFMNDTEVMPIFWEISVQGLCHLFDPY